MTKDLKIAIIGGGSSYTPEIIEGFIKRHSTFPVKEIYLVDIEEGKEKLEIVGNLAKRMIEASNIDCSLHLTLDLEEALKNASFVCTQLRVGLLKARALDERIPLSYGMLGQETNGAGGFMKAQRTIPVILDICKKIEKFCPDTWLINFTNPASMVTEAVLNHTNVKIIGVCNVPILYEKAALELFNTEEDKISIRMSGINHYSWVKEVYFEGENRLNDLMEYYLRDDTEINPKNIANANFVKEHIYSLGMIPSPYHMYYYLQDELLKHELEAYKNNGTRAEIVSKLEEDLFELYKDVNLKEKPKQLEERGGAYYSDVACNVMESIYNDRAKELVVNVKNNGLLPFLPKEAAIETTCKITSKGAIPLEITEFKEVAKAELIIMKTWEQLAIKVALTGDIGLALEAFMLNPLITSGHSAKKVLDDLIKAHINYLPQFQDYYNKYLK